MKNNRKIVFHSEVPVIKYHRKFSNSCCLSNLESAFHSIGDNRSATALDNHIEESLTFPEDCFRNRIDFANDI